MTLLTALIILLIYPGQIIWRLVAVELLSLSVMISLLNLAFTRYILLQLTPLVLDRVLLLALYLLNSRYGSQP
jgi:hypothetical protein